MIKCPYSSAVTLIMTSSANTMQKLTQRFTSKSNCLAIDYNDYKLVLSNLWVVTYTSSLEGSTSLEKGNQWPLFADPPTPSKRIFYYSIVASYLKMWTNLFITLFISDCLSGTAIEINVAETIQKVWISFQMNPSTPPFATSFPFLVMLKFLNGPLSIVDNKIYCIVLYWYSLYLLWDLRVVQIAFSSHGILAPQCKSNSEGW